MKMAILFLTAALLSAAEPDWRQVEQSAVELLQQYIRIQSINPPANTAEAAQFFKRILDDAGIPATLYPSGPNGQTNLVARIAGRDRSRKPLLLMNHFDVVPVDRKAWKVDPFAAVVLDGDIWGRGAMDMKGIGIEQLMALVTLKKSRITPARDIVMLSTADEETNGTYGIRWMIQNHFSDINAEYVLDEGGFGTQSILAPGKLVFGIAVGEKQTVWVRVRAHGTAAHGSQPIPDNANVPLFGAIRRAIVNSHPPAIVTPMLVPHGTDSNKLRHKGVIAYGLTPMVLDLSTAGSMHSDQEHIPIAEFKKGIHIFYDVLTSEF